MGGVKVTWLGVGGGTHRDERMRKRRSGRNVGGASWEEWRRETVEEGKKVVLS